MKAARIALAAIFGVAFLALIFVMEALPIIVGAPWWVPLIGPGIIAAAVSFALLSGTAYPD